MPVRKRDRLADARGQTRNSRQTRRGIQQPVCRARAGTHTWLPEGRPGRRAGTSAPEDLTVAGVCVRALDQAEELLVRMVLDGTVAPELWIGAPGYVRCCV